MTKKRKVLLIEDEMHIAEGLKLNLAMKGMEVELAANGRLGLEAWKKIEPDLVIVDLMMPEVDGIGVISKIRSSDPKVPILVISAKDQVKEKIRCLSLGVDDYLSKPFHLDEFLLRVERLLTRYSWSKEISPEPPEISHFSFGENFIDLKNLKGNCPTGEIELTAQEIKILKVFFTHPNTPLSREEILEMALGYDRGFSSRTLDNFIVRFRKYFESDAKNPRHFKSVRSVGYLFDPGSAPQI